MIATPAHPSFAAAQRYLGEWVVPFGLGRAHLVTTTDNFVVHTACGRDLVGPLPAARLWDGCEACVAHAEPK
jgi:hypothetical protein